MIPIEKKMFVFLFVTIFLIIQNISNNLSYAFNHSDKGELFFNGNCLEDICVGDTEAEVIKKTKGMNIKKIDLNLEGMPSPAIRLFYRSSIIDIEIDRGKVWRINLKGSNVKNMDAIGPNVTLKKLLDTYGTPKVVTGEGNVCLLFENKKGLSFCLDPNSIPNEFWTEGIPITSFKQDTLISSVLIVGVNQER